MRSSQLKHVLSHSCMTPKMLKKQIISEICTNYNMKFTYLDNPQ